MISSHNYHFLLVDDDPDYRMMTGIWLRSAGYDITEAKDGAEALAIIKKGHFDLLLVDISMPKINGMELVSQLRTLEIDTPIFMVTSQNDENLKKKAKTLGVRKYLLKPLEPGQLLQNIASELTH